MASVLSVSMHTSLLQLQLSNLQAGCVVCNCFDTRTRARAHLDMHVAPCRANCILRQTSRDGPAACVTSVASPFASMDVSGNHPALLHGTAMFAPSLASGWDACVHAVCLHNTDDSAASFPIIHPTEKNIADKNKGSSAVKQPLPERVNKHCASIDMFDRCPERVLVSSDSSLLAVFPQVPSEMMPVFQARC